MAIKVKIFGVLRLQSGIRELELPLGWQAKSLRKILNALGKLKGLEELARLSDSDFPSKDLAFIIMIDGKNCLQINGLDTLVKDGQLVAIFPPSAGG